ncbi:MAG: response regulator [Ignavibacteriales bacterium]|nr:response regulator [Ignavibacteriales bacterium]
MYKEPLSILLVDDEKTFVKVLALQLSEEYGFHTTIAYSGAEAIEILKNARRGFDVILLDYRMPDVNGLNVLQWMLEAKNLTPVIMLTAAGSEGVAVEAMKLGAYDYLRKEQIDVPHLVLDIQAVNERHLFRIERAIEEERSKEMGLNKEATDKMRDVINAITPTLNDTLAQIGAEIDLRAQKAVAQLPADARPEIAASLQEIQKQVRRLETGVRGLLSLFRIVHARHTETIELETIKREFESEVHRVEVGPIESPVLEQRLKERRESS